MVDDEQLVMAWLPISSTRRTLGVQEKGQGCIGGCRLAAIDLSAVGGPTPPMVDVVALGTLKAAWSR